MTMSSVICRQCLLSRPNVSRSLVLQRSARQVLVRRFESTEPKSSASTIRTTYEQADGKIRYVESSTEPPTIKNLALAAGLFGFVACVFTYSMKAVGKGDGNAESDPLAQLKAEAREAEEDNQHKRKLSPEEVEALESGLTGEYDETSKLEVAVAAPAEIAELEEEATLKVFRKKQGYEPEKKKKPWWRLGF
jgi:hypothetical protein